MTSEEFELGKKVVPHSKTVPGFGELFYSHIWDNGREQGFLYIVDITEEGWWVLSSESDPGQGGDFFMPSDVEPYVEETTKE